MDHLNIAQDLKDAFHEALTCTTCKITDLSKVTYRKHRESGYYKPLRDPPFPLPLHKYDIEVDPLFSINLDDHDDDDNLVSHAGTDSDTDTETDTDSDIDTDTNANTYTNQKEQAWECGYNDIMTPRERLLCHSLIDDYRTLDPTKDLLFARYRVDYHIHLHYLAARGMLNLCRNVGEMHEFRRWKWGLSMLDDATTSPSSSSSASASAATSSSSSQVASSNDNADADVVSDSGIGSASGTTFSTTPSSSTTSPNTTGDSGSDNETWQQAHNRYRHRRLHRWGWPDDIGFFMLYQTTLWRQAWEARRERVADARAKWSIIAEERWRQRRWGEWKNYWRRRDVRVGAYAHYEDDSEEGSQGEVIVMEGGSEDGSFSGSSFSCY